MLRVQKEHSGSGDVVTKLRLEIQQLREDSLLAKDLCNTRQQQNDVLSAQITELMTKIDTVSAWVVHHP